LLGSHVVEIKRPDILNKFLTSVQHLEGKTETATAILSAAFEVLLRVVVVDVPGVSEVNASSIFTAVTRRIVKIRTVRASKISTFATTEDGGGIYLRNVGNITHSSETHKHKHF
jgi:hypothetical protein